jgi:hypothetical protein
MVSFQERQRTTVRLVEGVRLLLLLFMSGVPVLFGPLLIRGLAERVRPWFGFRTGDRTGARIWSRPGLRAGRGWSWDCFAGTSAARATAVASRAFVAAGHQTRRHCHESHDRAFGRTFARHRHVHVFARFRFVFFVRLDEVHFRRAGFGAAVADGDFPVPESFGNDGAFDQAGAASRRFSSQEPTSSWSPVAARRTKPTVQETS